jgi:ring-1,2-phenylacetyl-CoA epoxidase subunit PaaD
MGTRRLPRAGHGTQSDDLALAWKVASSVIDPAIPALTIVDLGVLRDVRLVDGVVEAVITPTHSGCPAIYLIAMNVEAALENVGFMMPRIRTEPSPAWTPDWMTEKGGIKLKAYRETLPPDDRRCKACAASLDYFDGL